MRNRIGELLAPHGVDSFGVCRFADCLPLLPCRAAARIPQEARSVIVCLFPFAIGEAGEHPRRNVARYAVPDDYHRICPQILEQLAEGLLAEYGGEYAVFVDNSPFREVQTAMLAGLGVIGLHGMLLNQKWGGRVFIGTLATTLEIPPSTPLEGGCLRCGRCLAACPTGALQAGQPLQTERCRSHISQKKGALTQWEEQQLREGSLAWGCDICADACPMNTAALTPIRAFYRAPVPVITRAALSPLLQEKAYGWRGRPVLERNLALLEEPGECIGSSKE